MKFLNDVTEFHERFAMTYDGPPRPEIDLPTEIETDDEQSRRIAHLREEIDEYEDDIGRSTVSVLDSIVDLLYVTMGAAYLHGFTPAMLDEAWNRVHAANMRKVRGPSGKRGSQFDVVKPEGWVPPDLTDIVEPGWPRCSACGTDHEGTFRCGNCDAQVCGRCGGYDTESDVLGIRCPSCTWTTAPDSNEGEMG